MIEDDRGSDDIGEDSTLPADSVDSADSADPAGRRRSRSDDRVPVAPRARGLGDDSDRSPFGGTVEDSGVPGSEPMRMVDEGEHRRVEQGPSESSSASSGLGRYTIVGILGRGGMGVVFKAVDPTLDRRVALKVLHTELDKRHTTRMRREAQALARLSHPNVVQVYEVDEFEGQTFVAMELVKGQTLREWMHQEPRPSWERCVEVFVQVGAGLAAAHEQGLVHRDFKPSNAIIDDKGRARVLDFGLARQIGDLEEILPTEQVPIDEQEPVPLEVSLTNTGAVLGTPAYMPLEQMKGQEVDARSDQFSFCVALWEAVYGERPFEGSTMAGLMVSMMGGKVRPVPKGRRVPAKLRTVLLRGLAPEPDHRWPSMEALLEQLRGLVAPRRRPWLALGVAVGLAALGGGLAYRAQLEREAEREAERARAAEAQRCHGARAELDGIWDETRRQQVKDAIMGTELSYAPGTWARVEQHLDDYADAWVAEHTEVCEANSTPDDRSTEGTLAQVRCLDERKSALRAAVDVLAAANAQVVNKAVDLVSSLPRVSRCDDVDALLAEVPPPEDGQVAQQVQALRDRLADIEAMHEAGKYAEALRQIEPVVEQAEALGYGPLRAEARLWHGQLLDKDGQYAEAEQQLKQAHALVLEHEHARVALKAAQRLTIVVGDHLARHEEGRAWGQMAVALAKRSGENVDVAASLNNLGGVFYSLGEYEQAKLHLQRALQLRQEALGADHPHVAHSLSNLGVVFDSLGEYEQAKLHLQRALQIEQESLGTDHPDVASSLNILGAVFDSLGEYEQAKGYYQRALQMREKALGADHPDVAYSLTNLGAAFYGLGEYEQAERCHQRALRIEEKALGADHPFVAYSLTNLGNLFISRGDHEQAELHYQRALRIREKALGNDHPDVAFPLLGLAEVALAQHDAAAAREFAERAVSIREAAAVPPEQIATARFVLARALWRDRTQRARARTLAEQARDVFAQHPRGYEDILTDTNAWLAKHRVP